MKLPKPTNAEKWWNMVSTLVFVLLVIIAGKLFEGAEVDFREISAFELFIIILATYRVTRMLVYDRVFKLIRDLIRKMEGKGFGDSLKAIVTCPWCAGVWLALFNTSIYYLVPYGDLFVTLMAVAGVATFLQLSINVIGLKADEKQIDLKRKQDNESGKDQKTGY